MVILVAVIIYQLVEIVGVNGRRQAIKSEIDHYEQLIKESENDLDYLKSEQYLLELALQLGYYFPKD